jgi:chromosomal replication initiator protein
MDRIVLPRILTQEQTFEHFVVGDCNRQAHEVCRSVAEGDLAPGNPVTLCGWPGLGKTHLLRATAEMYLRLHPGARMVHTTCEELVSELVNSIHEQTVDAFRRQHHARCDLFLMSDIQFLAGKRRTQHEILRLLQDLVGHHCQVVLTATALPHEVPDLERKMADFLASGAPISVEPPDMRTRIAILEKLALRIGLGVPLTIIQQVAEREPYHIGELTSHLQRLVAADLASRSAHIIDEGQLS